MFLSVFVSVIVYIFVSVFVFALMMFMFSLERQELGAGTMYALAGTTFTKQTSVTFKISNIASAHKSNICG